MDGMINITGADLVEVAKAAYDLSVPQGMGFMHFKDGPLSDADAKNLVSDDDRVALSMDYVHGRACKLTVFKDDEGLWIRDSWFDHTPDQLSELLERIGIQEAA